MRLMIDSHLDLAWNALSFNRDQTETVDEINAREQAMVDHGARARATCSLPEFRRAGMAVCCATILVRAKRQVQPPQGHRRHDLDYGTQSIAYSMAQGQLAYYRLLEQQGWMKMIGTRAELDAHWMKWESATPDERLRLPIGNILQMEGADPIVEPAQAEAWYRDGLRSVTLSHYGKSHYSVGTGDDGPLTPRGVELLKELERLGVVLDLTHMSDQSFYQALEIFSGPVMASHNNCRAIVPADRQFSDEQIKLLIERKAVIGVALDAWMLRPGWIIGKTLPDGLTLASVVDQIDHICQLAGDTEHVAIGSDLDGGFGTEQTPSDLTTYNDLHKLETLMAARGYSAADIDQFFFGNWLRFFRRVLP